MRYGPRASRVGTDREARAAAVAAAAGLRSSGDPCRRCRLSPRKRPRPRAPRVPFCALPAPPLPPNPGPVAPIGSLPGPSPSLEPDPRRAPRASPGGAPSPRAPSGEPEPPWPRRQVAYDEKAIQTLDALAHIRLRTGMYIGRARRRLAPRRRHLRDAEGGRRQLDRRVHHGRGQEDRDRARRRDDRACATTAAASRSARSSTASARSTPAASTTTTSSSSRSA